MQIQLNGKPARLTDGANIAQLLEDQQLRGRLAVEVNGEIVPRAQYGAHRLSNGDTVEVVHAIGGG